MARLLPWEQLQETAKEALNVVDPPARITAGSGSVKGNGDVISPRFMCECKLRSKKNITVDVDHWRKLCDEAELMDRIPLQICENEDGEVIVSLRLNQLVEVINAYRS